MSRKIYTIGVLSKRTNVKVTTIRYYESIGLMDAPDRTESGQRRYGDDAVECLNFIRYTRELGFTIEAIRELIGLRIHPNDNCAAVDEIARRHLLRVRHRLSQLKALEQELVRMITTCKGGSVGACFVMSSLSDHEQCSIDIHDKLDLMPNK